jgi:CYTH domain-containing protein
LDRYRNIDLVILEVELDDINQEIDIPDVFADLIIMEVTGMEEFSNFNLSLEY